jgi:hypothetical protein
MEWRRKARGNKWRKLIASFCAGILDGWGSWFSPLQNVIRLTGFFIFQWRPGARRKRK